jgi:SAM-dependent methyltransferase
MAVQNTNHLPVMAFWGDTDNSWKKPAWIHWTQHPKVQERLNALVSGDPNIDRFQYFLRKYLDGRLPVERALTLGCGHGELERGISKYNLARVHEGVDIASGAIDEARLLAHEAGFNHLHYTSADLNAIQLPKFHYDVVFGVMSIHHIQALEHVFEQVSESLKPNGYFFLDEFIGPTRFQWSDAQLEAINRQLDAMPDFLKLRVDRPNEIRPPILRPTIEEMNSVDPSEAIRSAEIVPLVSRFFDIVEMKGCGGSLLQMLLDHIAGNFREDDPQALEYLRSLFKLEDEMIASGKLQHDFAVIIARKKESVSKRIDYYKQTVLANALRRGIAGNVKRLLRQIPPLGKVAGQRDELLERTTWQAEQIASFKAKLGKVQADLARALRFKTHYAPGHFYSALPSLQQLRAREEAVFRKKGILLPGIDLNEANQLQCLKTLGSYRSSFPFDEKDTGRNRYHFGNANFEATDGYFYYAMIRHLKPKRIVEVGCGYSSCLALDVNELYFQNSIDCTFIEPYPQLLYALSRPSDHDKMTVIQDYVQEVPLDVFAALEPGDILFIDSSHVSKTDSDLNHILFYVLPVLQRGVYIHFHDIFYPFEYPEEWTMDGRAFNECYMLRAFLTHNVEYKIELFANYLHVEHRDALDSATPYDNNIEPGSFWLRKLGERALPLSDVSRVDKARLTPSAKRQTPSSSHFVDLVHLVHPRQIGAGWYEYDKDLGIRWMAGRAEVRLAGPARSGQRLWLHANQPNPALVKITLTANQFVLGALQLEGPCEFVESFVLPDALTGESEILVTIELDKTWMAPEDPRKLGLGVRKILIDR